MWDSLNQFIQWLIIVLYQFPRLRTPFWRHVHSSIQNPLGQHTPEPSYGTDVEQ